MDEPSARDWTHGEPPQSVDGLGSVRARDGYSLGYRRYRPSGPPRASVLCVHGIQSHAGWYESSCRHLSEHGFDVYFADRRGSGMNVEDRGFCTGPTQLCDDLAATIEHVRRQGQGAPLFLLAISWGAKLAAATLRRRAGLIDGLALVTPGFAAKVGPTLRERLMIGWSFVFWPRRPIRVPLTEPTLFTDNPDRQSFLRHDERLLRIGTARLLMTSVFLDREIRTAAKFISVPTITFLAGQDRIIDNERVRAYVNGLASTDSRIVEYPSAHHTLEFEANPQPFFCDLTQWLIEQSDALTAKARMTG